MATVVFESLMFFQNIQCSVLIMAMKTQDLNFSLQILSPELHQTNPLITPLPGIWLPITRATMCRPATAGLIHGAFWLVRRVGIMNTKKSSYILTCHNYCRN